MISVVVPTLDGERELARCLAGVRRQVGVADVEIVVVDSESSDSTVLVARGFGARVVPILRSEFGHGFARNLGADQAAGDVLVFTSQDAEAADEHWLARLVEPLDDPLVVGTSGRQLPRPDAALAERYFLGFLYGPEPRRVGGGTRLAVGAMTFSNVNAAVRRDVWRRFPFAEDIVMSEDQEWAARVLEAGFSLVYVPEAVVRHSHDYSLVSAFRRFFDSGASAARSYLAAGPAAAADLRTARLAYLRGELAFLRRNSALGKLPAVAVYELVKLAGLELGRREQRLPSRLKRRLSATPSFWRDPPES